MQRPGKEMPVADLEYDAQDEQASAGESRVNFWDLAIEAMLAPLLLFMPLALGTVEPWSELVVFVVVTAMCLCLVGKLVFQRGARFLWSWAYLPIVIFIACVGLQLLPLPARLVQAISPHTVQLKTEFLSDAPDAQRVLDPMPLTFYRPGTLHDLRIVLAAAALMVIVANTFRTPRQVRRLLMTVVSIGGVVGVIALTQDLYQTHSIYGLEQFHLPSATVATGGPFVDRSHFAQFMNLSIGFALGLLLVRLHELFPGKDISPARLATPWHDHGVWAVWLAVGVIVIGATAVCLSMSRAGLVSMVAAGIVVGAAISFSRKSRGRGSFLSLLALVIFACVLYLGFDAVSERFTTTHDVATVGGRLQMVKDLRPVWRRFPILGTGLGTHQMVFPMFDTSATQTNPEFVEVELAQMMEEMGAVGVLLVLTFVVMIAVALARGVRRKHPIHGAAMGLAFGLGAVFLHSFTDFGQHFLADASLSAISCGLVLALSRSMRPSADSDSASTATNSPQQRLFPRGAGIAASVVLTGLLALSLPDAISAKRAAYHADLADSQATWLAGKNWSGSDADFHDLLAEAAWASRIQPEDAHYNWLLNDYRWRSLCRTSQGEQAKEFALTEPWLSHARRVVDELKRGRLLCPTYGAAPALEGEIEYLYLKDPVGADHIRLGARLSPHDALVCYIWGQLDAAQGDFKSAAEHFTHAVTVNADFGDAAIEFCLDEVHNPDLAAEVAQGKPQWLLRVADMLDEHKTASKLSTQCRDQAFSLLKASAMQPNPPAGDLAMLGDLYFARGDFQTAGDYFSRALEGDYGQALWHLRLAECLEKDGKSAAACREAEVCLRYQKGLLEAEQVLDRNRDYADTKPAGPTTASDK